ncbi:TetR/AcrR family transcriptional regulator (plasmid) [Mycolicibacterium farcinogenes]|uniref:TetR/AcrR family transcriptional regulator n=1 Tax=Mycolicibacterium farcinogenes TaxID=1802 RepID=A0ACD1FQR1_MYCFR|nr:TetR/AcrR family transcriptional regulator [Mycolicibacterium farcinogenes]
MGYEGATFQAVALRAKVTRPAVLYHFSDKRLLFREVVAQASNAVMSPGIERACAGPTLAGQMTAPFFGLLCQAILTASQKQPFWWRR